LVAFLKGYWIAFRPGQDPARRILTWVLLPSLGSLLAICGFWLYSHAQPRSVLDRSGGWTSSIPEMATELCALGPGLYPLIFGIVLVGVFVVRLWRHKSSLPLALADRNASFDAGGGWRRTEILIWAILSAQAVASSMISGTLSLALLWLSATWLIPLITPIVETGVLLGACVLTVGGEDVKTVWRRLWRVRPFEVLLGALFPVLLALVFSVAVYLPERVEWATGGFGKSFAPLLLPEELRFDPWWLLLIFAAFAEEFVFRGIL